MPLSNFWQEINKLDKMDRCSVSYSPGTESQFKFWTDSWDQLGSLATQFPQLFEICSNPHVQLREVINTQGRVVKFWRQFDMFSLQEWSAVLSKISSISFTHTYDRIA